MNKKPNPELVDDENPEWTDEMFKQSVRLDALPASLQAKLRGRPKAIVTKEAVKLRLDADVLAALRASGDGWHRWAMCSQARAGLQSRCHPSAQPTTFGPF